MEESGPAEWQTRVRQPEIAEDEGERVRQSMGLQDGSQKGPRAK